MAFTVSEEQCGYLLIFLEIQLFISKNWREGCKFQISCNEAF